MKHLLSFILALTISLFSFSQTATRTITKIKGDLYRFQNNGHYSVFLITDEGAIVTDPINKDAATWLKAEIKKRFDLPVKYVIYSHHHDDHVSGGEVFDEAIFVGHTLTKKNIEDKKIPTPVPNETFKTRKLITLGNQYVALIYPGKSHSDDCIAIYFPDEKVVFGVDFISVDRLPYRTLNGAFLPDWIQAIKKVETLDFDTFVPGHGDMGTKTDVKEHREYFEALYNAVKEAKSKGQSLDEMKRSILLEAYKDFSQYDAWREMNIEGVYNFLTKK
ncbi:MBL fold metallo-hydrolase [Flavobacteriaceae bacterium AU392]|nr:MBL fold metallo-hydrolase [Flavobacteriaceae bacterium]RKM84794.1 MBL fold metallo-hydrolase [Flavobacteriaceae bacterium AU392]